MTKLLDHVVETVRGLPADRQDTLARLLMQFAEIDAATLELAPDEAVSFEESLAQAERGEFASDDEVRAIWAKHGL